MKLKKILERAECGVGACVVTTNSEVGRTKSFTGKTE